MDHVRYSSLFLTSKNQLMLKKDRLNQDNITFYWFTITVFFNNTLYIKIFGHCNLFKHVSYFLLTSWENLLNIPVTPDFSVLQDTFFPLELPV